MTDEPTHVQELAGTTVRSIGWSVGSQGVQQVLSVAFSLIITRLLVPRAFGLVGEVSVFFGLGYLLSEFGLGTALVQRADVSEEQRSSAFWAQFVLGLMAAALVAAASPLIASFYGEPRLVGLTVAMAPMFILSSAGSVHRSLLTRSMRFRRMATVDLAATLLAGLVGGSAAALGAGVWSLVAQGLVGTATTTAGLWAVTGWRPRLLLSRSAMASLSRFTRNLFGFNFLNYMVRNIDNALVGRVLGAAALGLYARAYTILLYPTAQLTSVVGRVMFSALSRIKDDKDRVRAGYLRTVAVLALISFPSMMGLALVSDDLVRIGLGHAWLPAVPVIQIFCLVGINESILTSVGWIYQSQGRTDWLFRWGLVGGGAVVAGIVGGVIYGSVTGVAVGYAASSVLLTYPSYAIPGRLIGMRVREVVRAVGGVALCTATMGLVVLALRLGPLAHVRPIYRLLGSSGAGAVTFLALMHGFRLAAYGELRGLMTRRAPPVAT